jgi:hypothetical protein
MASYAYTFVSGDTVTPTKLNNARTISNIVNADVSATAAIVGTKIAPDFGSQNVVTAGTATLGANSQITQAGVTPRLQIQGTNAGGSSIGCMRFSNDSATNGMYIAKSRSTTIGTNTIVQNGDQVGKIQFNAADGTNYIEAANIIATIDGTPGANDMPGRLVFSTTADGGSSPTERMRITSNGDVLIGVTAVGAAGGLSLQPTGAVSGGNSGGALMRFDRAATASSSQAIQFRDGGTICGSIGYSNTATTYATSSDYRLKQNVEPMVGGLAKLAALLPKTFEFINEPNVKVDGFIAHEVQAVVPQAVTGEKDGEEMQGLDHSKLVPVLVAAVQELSAKVAALEAA